MNASSSDALLRVMPTTRMPLSIKVLATSARMSASCGVSMTAHAVPLSSPGVAFRLWMPSMPSSAEVSSSVVVSATIVSTDVVPARCSRCSGVSSATTRPWEIMTIWSQMLRISDRMWLLTSTV